ncbi:MAG: DUF2062 domain-containing protein [Candidatus Omnitrophota bacterium]
MWSVISLPVRIIKLLEENTSSVEVAGGVCLGLFLGFTPLNGPFAFLLALFFFLVKINRASTLLTLPLFKLLYIFGGAHLADRVGSYLLIDAGYLAGFWSFVTNLPVLAYLNLNTTIVIGGIALALIAAVPVFIGSRLAVIGLRRRYAEKMKNSKVSKFIDGLKKVHSTAAKVDRVRSHLR